MRTLGLLLFLVVLGGQSHAQNTTDYVIYIWENGIYAQPLDGGDWRPLLPAFYNSPEAMPESTLDVYRIENSPADPIPDFGFVHGVWNNDRTTFAYLMIQADQPTYRLYQWSADGTVMLLEQALNDRTGYLSPLGWTNDNELLLLERYMLHNVDTIRVWLFDGSVRPYANGSVGNLHGRSATNGNSAFVGFDLENRLGYVFDFASRQLQTFPIDIGLPEERGSVFETYPVQILGVLPESDLSTFASNLSELTPKIAPQPAPFLHWPLPDTDRLITCYPDSPYTAATQPATCPQRGDYDGHQGTDVGGRPDGLARGTNIYASIPGLVIDTFTTCDELNPSCGDAYGNYLTMEHHIIFENNIQTWYTGYAHLSLALAEPYTFISDIGAAPIATSGATGSGGPHLHFEVRFPHGLGVTRWIDPWDTTITGNTLWVGNDRPTSAVN